MQRVADGSEEGLPPVVQTFSKDAWDIWVTWRGLDRKHLPYAGGFLDQPDDLITDLMTYDSIFDKITRPSDGG